LKRKVTLHRKVEAVGELLKEMEPYMVNVPDVDDSREAIYSRKPGE